MGRVSRGNAVGVRPLNSIVRQHQVETKMKQCHSKMPNPISVEAPVTSNRRCRHIGASFGRGKARGISEASAEHRFSNDRGSLMSAVLAVANARRRCSVVTRERGSVAYGRMLSNISFERTVVHCGPHPCCPRPRAGTMRQAASWPAAQLDR